MVCTWYLDTQPQSQEHAPNTRSHKWELKFDPSMVISFDTTTTRIDLLPVLTPTMQNYITTLITKLGEQHQTLSMAHDQLQHQHQLELTTHDPTHAQYQQEV
jgi:hypothetical protein